MGHEIPAGWELLTGLEPCVSLPSCISPGAALPSSAARWLYAAAWERNRSQFPYSLQNWDRTGKKVTRSEQDILRFKKKIYIYIFIGNGLERESFFQDLVWTGIFSFNSLVMELGWDRVIFVGAGWDWSENPLLCHPHTHTAHFRATYSLHWFWYHLMSIEDNILRNHVTKHSLWLQSLPNNP